MKAEVLIVHPNYYKHLKNSDCFIGVAEDAYGHNISAGDDLALTDNGVHFLWINITWVSNRESCGVSSGFAIFGYKIKGELEKG